ncbi:ESX-1 secretion-associated protein [Nocardia sp. CDC159]|uniref:ESX-1 secretion-associated protein n=1 Tax=Nocardia pulmonis TaxID=2951408 RepID=A0A9X2E5Q4_9NOCA|nr:MULTISPECIES: type VII secretion target [Nocardia]MCM6774719.1 ESX-1 secretion-associated protein [Nocardia pulmonis]MCM6787216.1 ESX-1 secretion-associated protein [Nocardia sp. CDC159]
MSDLSLQTEAVQAFAATHEGVAADIAGAGNMDTVGHIAAMTPVFGVIGADYLAMFAAAQVLHAKDINDLSARVDHLGKAAFGTVAVLGDTDQGGAGVLGGIGGQIGA